MFMKKSDSCYSKTKKAIQPTTTQQGGFHEVNKIEMKNNLEEAVQNFTSAHAACRIAFE